MSDSTTHQKKSKAAANGEIQNDASNDMLSAFERELQKKIRNKMKKLEKI
jgi:U3 small nucleolar ribonucleoprotein component